MAYKRGQEVFRDPKPFIYVVNPKYCKIVCDCCLKLCENEGILKACAICKWVHYCDQTCQKDAWKSHHKLECKYLQMLNNTKELKDLFGGSFQEVLLQLLKTTLKLKNKGQEEFFLLPDGKKRHFADLVSNADELREQKAQKNKLEVYHLIFDIFKSWLGDDAIPTFTEMFQIIGKWQTNGTSITAKKLDEPSDRIATGLYLGYSGLDHSCAPNAVWFNVGKEMVVRAIEDVDNFSEIRISYFDEREKTEERKNYLKKVYFFDCKCVRCEDPNSDAKFASLKCKSCPGWVHEDTMICSSCNQTLKLTDEEMIIVEWYKNGNLTMFEPTMTTKEIKYNLEKFIKVFHVFHQIFGQCNKVLEFSKIISQYQKRNHETMSLVLEIVKLWLNHCSGHLPQYHKVFAFDYTKISRNCIELKLFDEAKNHLKKAEETIKITFGEDHPYMKECQQRKTELQCASLSLK